MIDTRFSVSIQIMMTVADHPDELVTSDLLAMALSSNPTFIRKVVSKLVEAELIKSYRGKGGGIQLARKAQEISLYDIYLASTDEKPLINVHNKPVYKKCAISCSIQSVLNEVFNEMETVTQKYLAKQTLHDLMRKV